MHFTSFSLKAIAHRLFTNVLSSTFLTSPRAKLCCPCPHSQTSLNLQLVVKYILLCFCGRTRQKPVWQASRAICLTKTIIRDYWGRVRASSQIALIARSDDVCKLYLDKFLDGYVRHLFKDNQASLTLNYSSSHGYKRLRIKL